MRFTTILAALGGCLALAGCMGTAHPPVEATPVALTASDQGFIHRNVIDDLLDPDAAKLRRVSIYELGGGAGRAICGEVNAKNSYGAYTGYQPFYLRVQGRDVVSQVVPDEEGFLGDAAARACDSAAAGAMLLRGKRG